MFSFLFNILLGQSCVGCKQMGTLLCATCEERLPLAPERSLPGHIITCLSYGDARVRKLVGMLKFRSAWTVATPLGRILYERLLEDLGDALLFSGLVDIPSPRLGEGEPPHQQLVNCWCGGKGEVRKALGQPLLLVVPIPLSPARLRQRGYNQAELLARALLKHASSSIVIPDLIRDPGIQSQPFEFIQGALSKTRDTKRQVQTNSRDERLSNLRNAFKADPKKVQGRHIILLDDVATTGATLCEAKQALHQAGAASVTCLALAH